MTEHTRGRRRPQRPHPRAVLLYRSVLEAIDDSDLLAARQSEGLTDEITLARLLLRQQLAQDPDNTELTIKGLHLLARLVTAQHHLSDADATSFNEGVQRALDQFSANILGVEAVDG